MMKALITGASSGMGREMARILADRYDELVLVVNKNNEVLASTLYNLGILPTAEYKEILEERIKKRKGRFTL